MHVVSVCGGIAVGKTTLCGMLSAHDKSYELRLEDPTHVAFIKNFYEDRKRWAFHSRMGMLAYFLTRDAVDSNHENIIQDRSFHELIVFATAQLRNGAITEEEYALYGVLFAGLSRLVPRPDCVVRCTCPVNVALQRVKTRGRTFESNINKDYLSLIEALYDQWISELPKSTRIIVVDTSREISVSDVWQQVTST